MRAGVLLMGLVVLAGCSSPASTGEDGVSEEDVVTADFIFRNNGALPLEVRFLASPAEHTPFAEQTRVVMGGENETVSMRLGVADAYAWSIEWRDVAGRADSGWNFGISGRSQCEPGDVLAIGADGGYEGTPPATVGMRGGADCRARGA